MRTRERLVIGVICAVSSLAAQTWPVNLARLKGAAQDSAGQVWAFGYDPNLALYRWQSEKWVAAPVDGLAANAQPMAVAAGSDGAVYCVWSVGADSHAVTRHQGAESRILAQFHGPLADLPNIFVDSHRMVWITERGPRIYRVTPEGKAECAYTIPDEDYLANAPFNVDHPMFNPLLATSDAQGHIWFWSGGMMAKVSLRSLRGLLIFDGESFKYQRRITADPEERITAIEPDDAEHMWVALAEDGLYRVDSKTLTATPVSAPEGETFNIVEGVFRSGTEIFVISGAGGVPVAEPRGEGRFNVLWRQKDGAWERLVAGLDMSPNAPWDPSRPLLATPNGTWVGAYGTGPWFIPSRGQEPVHLDWHYNYPFDGSQAIFRLPDGRLLLVGANRGSLAAKPEDLLAAYQSPVGIRTLNPLRTFVQDQRGHLWGLLSSAASALSEWDGETWKPHPLPEDFSDPRRYNFAADSDDNIWLVMNPCQGRVTVFNAPQGTFASYHDLPAALQAQLPRHPQFHAENNFRAVATFTADGRIGYRDPCAQLHYFDGHEWLNWQPQEVLPGNGHVFDGRAFFDRVGNFALNIDGKTWEYRPGTGWQNTTFEPAPGSPRVPRPQSLPSPSGCPFNHPESMARDRLGTYWMVYRGQLYRALPGLCLARTSADEHQPFVDGRILKAALLDPQGNAFLETYLPSYTGVGEYTIVEARRPLPTTRMQSNVEAGGTVKLHLAAATNGKAWFTWRVDGEAWSDPSPDQTAIIPGLSEGKHRIEAAAIDERLQIDPKPALAEVEIRGDNGKELAVLVEQLKDPDFSVREAAVAGLVRQPVRALPLLQAVRETATPEQRWWIDAAIQQIKAATSKNKEP